MEELLVPHMVREGMICISTYKVLLACLGLDLNLKRRNEWADAPMEHTLGLVMHLSGFRIRSKAGTRIGGRMGRPGKSKPRKMNPPPHSLFPLGEAGGSRRSFQEASNHSPEANKDGGVIRIETGRRRCPSCGTDTYHNRCACGAHTVAVYTCQRCKRESVGPECPACKGPTSCSQTLMLNVRQDYLLAMERLGRRENPIGLVKGVKGLISRERAVEEIDKGILRAENGALCIQGRHDTVWT